MDFASIVGIIGAGTVVVVAIFIGGSFGQFVDVPSGLIVIGGGLMATLVRFPIGGIFGAFIVGAKAGFIHKKADPRALIEQITEMADVVRRNGPLGLEGMDVTDPVLAKGAQFVADGHEGEFIEASMSRERDLLLERLSEGKRVFKALGDSAPAFGMIGTLVGLVQMLATMDDPSTIGPSMAVALLTTLYGAVISNVICLPLVDKLDSKFATEELNQTLIIDGIMQIRAAKSPNLIREMLLAYLPEAQRAGLADRT